MTRNSRNGLKRPRGQSRNCIQLRRHFWDKLFLHRELFWKVCLSLFNNQK